LSCFSASRGHFELAVYLFGYLKKYPNQWLVLNFNSLLVYEELHQSSFHPDFLEDYDGAKEEISTRFPNPYGNELESFWHFLMPTMLTISWWDIP
jgi:hypothetical protein